MKYEITTVFSDCETGVEQVEAEGMSWDSETKLLSFSDGKTANDCFVACFNADHVVCVKVVSA